MTIAGTSSAKIRSNDKRKTHFMVTEKVGKSTVDKALCGHKGAAWISVTQVPQDFMGITIPCKSCLRILAGS